MTVLSILLSLYGGEYKHFYFLDKLGPAPTIGKCHASQCGESYQTP
jgi:hypothetical protein